MLTNSRVILRVSQRCVPHCSIKTLIKKHEKNSQWTHLKNFIFKKEFTAKDVIALNQISNSDLTDIQRNATLVTKFASKVVKNTQSSDAEYWKALKILLHTRWRWKQTAEDIANMKIDPQTLSKSRREINLFSRKVRTNYLMVQSSE